VLSNLVNDFIINFCKLCRNWFESLVWARVSVTVYVEKRCIDKATLPSMLLW